MMRTYGTRLRVSNRKEVKFTIVHASPVDLLISQFSPDVTYGRYLWSTLNTSSANYGWQQPDFESADYDGIVGRSAIALGFDIRFAIVDSGPDTTTGTRNLCRIIIFKDKPYSSFPPGLANMPTRLNEPLDTKVWTLILDKTFKIDSGRRDANEDGYGDRNVPKQFKFKIPFKQKMVVTRDSSQSRVQFKQNIHMVIGTDFTFEINDWAYVHQFMCKFYFKDDE